MHLISVRTLVNYAREHVQAKNDLDAWAAEVKHAHWKTPMDIKEKYSSASFLCDNRVVFNIHGNDFRLLVRVNYASETVFVLFVGTHAEYDKKEMEGVGR